MDLYEHNAATTTIVQKLISDKFVQKVLSIYKSAIESTNSPPSNLVIIFSSLYFLHFISQWNCIAQKHPNSSTTNIYISLHSIY